PEDRHTSRSAIVKRACSALVCRARGAAALGAIAVMHATGCAVGPDYRPPDMPDAAGAPFAAADSELFAAVSPPVVWWRLYDDPALDSAVLEALDANTDLRAAAANLARAEAALREVRGRRLPTTTLNLG